MMVYLEYQSFEQFKRFCYTNNITIVQVQFEEKICCIIEIALKEKEEIMQKMKKEKLNIQKIQILKNKNIRKS